jgi:DNA-binding CsgD family transcriptional regulator
MRKTPAYSRVAKPWKLEHFLISAIHTGNGISAFLSLGRARHGSPYVDGDKKIFRGLLLSHLERSITLHRALGTTREINSTLSAIIDLSPYGVVAFDTRGRPLIVNKRASKIFGSNDGLALINGRLHASVPEAHARLENALAMSVHGALGAMIAPPDAVTVPRKGHAQPYHVVFSRLEPGDSALEFPAGSAVMAMIHEDWLTDSKYLPTTLRNTYSLSEAEIRLCQAMLEGKSLVQAASELNISRNTAKTHLTRIFGKTRVHSQAALLRLLSSGIRPKLPILNDPSTAGSRAGR